VYETLSSLIEWLTSEVQTVTAIREWVVKLLLPQSSKPVTVRVLTVREGDLLVSFYFGDRMIKESTSSTGYSREKLAFGGTGRDEKQILTRLFEVFSELDEIIAAHRYDENSALLLLKSNCSEAAFKLVRSSQLFGIAVRTLLKRFGSDTVV
jgi:hypothetical protein